MTPEPLGRTLDLADPETLCLALEDLAGGMRQQTAAAQSGTAMGGHPNPSFLYARVEEVLRAAKQMIVDRFITPTAGVVRGTPTTPDTPAGTADAIRAAVGLPPVEEAPPPPPTPAPAPAPVPKPAPAGRK